MSSSHRTCHCESASSSLFTPVTSRQPGGHSFTADIQSAPVGHRHLSGSPYCTRLAHHPQRVSFPTTTRRMLIASRTLTAGARSIRHSHAHARSSPVHAGSSRHNHSAAKAEGCVRSIGSTSPLAILFRFFQFFSPPAARPPPSGILPGSQSRQQPTRPSLSRHRCYTGNQPGRCT